MKSIILVFLMVLIYSTAQDDYDPAKSIEERTRKYRKVCEKYDDPRRPEYSALFKPKLNLIKFYKDYTHKVVACVPPKVGSRSFRRFMAKQENQNRLEKEAKNIPLGQGIPKGDKEVIEFYGQDETHRTIQVRHPLERLLSTYLFIFIDSTVHRPVTDRVKEIFIKNNFDLLKVRDGEDTRDVSGDPTLSFRQFVHFLTHCAEESPECVIPLSEGLAEHWVPYWRWCYPCSKGHEFDSILYLNHAVEDLTHLASITGMNATNIVHDNPTKVAKPSSSETKKKYFRQLRTGEIYELYLKYKLDHELFGYSPDEYLAMAKDYEDNNV